MATDDGGQGQTDGGTQGQADPPAPVFDLAIGTLAVTKPDDPTTVFVPFTNQAFLLVWTEGRVDQVQQDCGAFTDGVFVDMVQVGTATAAALAAGASRTNLYSFSAGLPSGAHQLNVQLNVLNEVLETNFVNNVMASPIILDIQDDPSASAPSPAP